MNKEAWAAARAAAWDEASAAARGETRAAQEQELLRVYSSIKTKSKEQS